MLTIPRKARIVKASSQLAVAFNLWNNGALCLQASAGRLWLGRILIGLVFLWNVQCAVAFLVAPATFAPGFELSGAAGEAAVRGMGVLFLMWNVPYARRAVAPGPAPRLALRGAGDAGHRAGRGELDPVVAGRGHPVAAGTVLRFIAFDGAGVTLLRGRIVDDAADLK